MRAATVLRSTLPNFMVPALFGLGKLLHCPEDWGSGGEEATLFGIPTLLTKLDKTGRNSPRRAGPPERWDWPTGNSNSMNRQDPRPLSDSQFSRFVSSPWRQLAWTVTAEGLEDRGAWKRSYDQLASGPSPPLHPARPLSVDQMGVERTAVFRATLRNLHWNLRSAEGLAPFWSQEPGRNVYMPAVRPILYPSSHRDEPAL